MIINNLLLQNVGNHKLIQVNFDQSIVAIYGANGSGKTFLIESIPACLYGVFPSRPGSIYNKIGNDAKITLCFEYEGDHYVATRVMNGKKGTSEGYLYVEDSIISGPKISDFETTISEMLGSYESFISSVFSSQKIAGDICDFRPSERKKFFSDLFGLDRLEKLSIAAGQKALMLEKKQEEIKNQMDMLNNFEDQQQIDVEELEIKLASINKLMDNKTQELNNINLLASLVSELASLKLRKESMSGLNIPEHDVCKKCSLVSDHYKELDNINKKIVQLVEKTKDYDSEENKTLNIQLKDLITSAGEIISKIQISKHKDEMMERVRRISSESVEDPACYILMEEAFGRNGIQPLIIESEKGPLEGLINEVLSTLTDGKMNMEFTTLRELKSGRQAESLDIIVYKQDKKLQVSELSGGEQRLVKIAIRMALAINNNKHSIKTLIIDEVFDDLDSTSSSNVLNTIKSFSKYFARVLIVSHDDRLLSELPASVDLSTITS